MKLTEFIIRTETGQELKVRVPSQEVTERTFLTIWNGGACDSGWKNQPSEEPWTADISPDYVDLSFPKANFALPESDPRHPSQWDSERVKKWIRERIIPSIEKRQQA